MHLLNQAEMAGNTEFIFNLNNSFATKTLRHEDKKGIELEYA